MATADKPTTRVARGQVRVRLLEYFKVHPGIVVFANDIIDSTGLNHAQVKQGIWGLRNDNPQLAQELEVIVAGSAWCYRPHRGQHLVSEQSPATPDATPTTSANNATRRPSEEARRGANRGDAGRLRDNDAPINAGRLFEQIGVADNKSGDILIRDHDGTVWVAQKLKFHA